MNLLIKAMVVFITMLLVGSCDNSTENKGDNEPDSTTQNFTFEEYEFGDGGNSSYFNDVWIFDENNIWVVGEVYHDPVLSPTNEYNIVQWNGAKWVGRGRGFNSVGIYGLWPIDSSHIYFAVGIVLEYKNGEFNWMDFSQLNFSQGQSVEHLWGSSESNIWGVGPWGTVVHYDGSKWSKLEFDTQYYFYDITGIKETGEAYAVARNSHNNMRIIKLNNSGWSEVYNNEILGMDAWSVERASENELYLTGGDMQSAYVWIFNVKDKTKRILGKLPADFAFLTQTAYSEKDAYFFGRDAEKGGMAHYNGKRLTRFDLTKRSVNYGGAHAIKDLAAYAGYADNKAFIILIKRR